jgi:hypothetical protein
MHKKKKKYIVKKGIGFLAKDTLVKKPKKSTECKLLGHYEGYWFDYIPEGEVKNDEFDSTFYTW